MLEVFHHKALSQNQNKGMLKKIYQQYANN